MLLALSIARIVIAKKCQSCGPVYLFGFYFDCFFATTANRLVASFFIGNSA